LSPSHQIFAGDRVEQLLLRYRSLLAKSPRRRAMEFGLPLATLGLAFFSIWWLGISIEQIGPGLAALAKFIALMFPPSTGGHLQLFLKAMGETLAIAFLGTLTAAILAAPLGLLAAKNTTPSLLLRFLIRRLLDTIRGIDTLIWALVFVGVVGLGPFAGILAMAVSDTGAFGKLFSEAVEATEARERETVVAGGGTGWMAVRFGLLPQVLPVIASQILYFFESNTRSGDDHRHRRRRRRRPAAFRADPNLRFRSGLVHHSADSCRGRGHRLDLRQAPLRDHRPNPATDLIHFLSDQPDRSQFSRGISSIRANSRSLSVTRTQPSAITCAAISRSLPPIGWPACSNLARRTP